MKADVYVTRFLGCLIYGDKRDVYKFSCDVEPGATVFPEDCLDSALRCLEGLPSSRDISITFGGRQTICQDGFNKLKERVKGSGRHITVYDYSYQIVFSGKN